MEQKQWGSICVFSEPDQNSSLKTVIELSKELKKSGFRIKEYWDFLNRKKMTADTDAILAESINGQRTLHSVIFFTDTKKEAAHISEEELKLPRKILPIRDIR